MIAYLVAVVAMLAPFVVACLPVGGKDRVGRRFVLTENGWVEADASGRLPGERTS